MGALGAGGREFESRHGLWNPGQRAANQKLTDSRKKFTWADGRCKPGCRRRRTGSGR